jgi:hypothetical protein
MTTEERLDRIEHVTAGIAEEHRKDHAENRQLWRDTQRQINELSARTLQMGDELRYAIDRLAEESRAAHKRFDDADQRLSQRIDGLTSAIGQLIARMGVPPQA